MKQILIPSCSNLVLETGKTSIIRPVPPHPETKERPWIIPIHAMHTNDGLVALPSTFRSRLPLSIIEQARAFLAVNYPLSLRCEQSPRGIVLEPEILALGWVITEHEKQPRYCLVLEKAGEESSCGLGLQIYKAARGTENTSNACDAFRGAFLEIDRNGCRRLPGNDSDISDLVSAMTEQERIKWRPLEEVVKIITPREQRRLLKKYMSREMLIAFQNYLATSPKPPSELSARCPQCFTPICNHGEQHHFIPIKDGGKTKSANTQILCTSCHHKKHQE